jgi:hypothetical protein
VRLRSVLARKRRSAKRLLATAGTETLKTLTILLDVRILRVRAA